MTNSHLISVVVPIYNIDRYVGLCIESLITQTYENLEIILVDDGSTDRSGELCDLYATKDPRIRVIHKPNGGLVSARKAGVAIARGAYIGHVDGDDWVEPDFYETLYRSAVKADADIVCAGYSRDLFKKHVRLSNNVLDGVYEGDSLRRLWGEMLSYGKFFSIGLTTYVWNKLFRAGIAKEVQARVDDRITIGEDAAVTYPAILSAKRIYVCDKAGYHYRQREDSMLKRHASIEDEIGQIRLLDKFLQGSFEGHVCANVLLRQLDDFVDGYLIMRSGGILADGSTSFGGHFAGKRVAIVSAGTFGQAIRNRIDETGYCEVVGWFDDDYWEYRRCGMDVDPMSSITESGADVVLIAKTDEYSVKAITSGLHEAGIDEERILSIELGSHGRVRACAAACGTRMKYEVKQ